MSNFNLEDIHLKLLAGLPIGIDGIGELRSPKLKEIINLGASIHGIYLSYLIFSKQNLENQSKDIQNHSDFEILMSIIHQHPPSRELFFNGLRLYFNKEPKYFPNEHIGVVYFDQLSDETILTEEKFEQIKKLLQIANFIEDEKEEYNPANEQAKKLIDMIKKNRKKQPKKKEKINLHSLMSAVAWKSLGIKKVANLTVYQLYDAFRRLENINNHHFTLLGIYTGNIDGKKINLPDVNWANILK